MKLLKFLKNLIIKLFDVVKILVKNTFEFIINLTLDRSFKTIYVVTIKCDGKIIETDTVYGSEKNAILKLIKMNKNINCQGNKIFEITKITPDEIKNILKKIN